MGLGNRVYEPDFGQMDQHRQEWLAWLRKVCLPNHKLWVSWPRVFYSSLKLTKAFRIDLADGNVHICVCTRAYVYAYTCLSLSEHWLIAQIFIGNMLGHEKTSYLKRGEGW